MKLPLKFFCASALVISFSAVAATFPAAWPHEQSFEISAGGLIKISLPDETLAAARPALEDLRLYDDAGNEIPFLIERPAPVPKIIRAAKSFQVSLDANDTVITLETGMMQPLDAVSLETPALNFIKAVRLESSTDGKKWETLAQGRPIFRQLYGAASLQLSFPSVAAKWLRLTVDDHRSPPVPFTGAQLHAANGEPAPVETVAVKILARDEGPGQSRLTLDLGAANLDISNLKIETGEPLFMRQISVAVPQVVDEAIREQIVAQGTIYRVAVEGQPSSENLFIPLQNQFHPREIFLLVENGDSPPLPVSAVNIERRPVHLIFLARQPGKFHLLTGHPDCPAPQYDLAALTMNLKSIPVAGVKISTITDNLNYAAPEALPGIGTGGTGLNISEWKFRKQLKVSGVVQQVELDLDVLAHAQPDFDDLRLLHGSNQVSYIIARTSISRAVELAVIATNDFKNPQLSRWQIKLPRAGLPLTRLTCVSPTSLFERSFSIYEEGAGERGEKYRREIGQARWTQTPGKKSQELTMTFNTPPQGDLLFLETENGDNPPVELKKFAAFYPATRILFKAKPGDYLQLYYGNPQAGPPHYDLSLVADQLLAAEKQTGTFAVEEPLQKSSWRDKEMPGKGGAIFWGILALVVAVLLLVISKLLPKAQNPAS